MKGDEAKNDNLEKSREIILEYIKALTDVARESFLVLNSNLRIIKANPTFYQNFQVSEEQTEDKFIFDLGNGQWNIPELVKLLKEILPKNKIVKNYEVKHVFEMIGEKTMLLNARQIDSMQLIILAIEDITEKNCLEEKLAEYTKGLEIKITERTAELADRVKELEMLNKTMVGRELRMVELKKEIEDLRKGIKNGNGKNGNGKGSNGNKNS
jgi:hypothetical protein